MFSPCHTAAWKDWQQPNLKVIWGPLRASCTLFPPKSTVHSHLLCVQLCVYMYSMVVCVCACLCKMASRTASKSKWQLCPECQANCRRDKTSGSVSHLLFFLMYMYVCVCLCFCVCVHSTVYFLCMGTKRSVLACVYSILYLQECNYFILHVYEFIRLLLDSCIHVCVCVFT